MSSNLLAIAGYIHEEDRSTPVVPLCMGCLMIASEGSHLFWHMIKTVHLPITAICAGCGKPYMSDDSIDAADKIIRLLREGPDVASLHQQILDP